jgi:hypothetical protein
MPKRWGLDEGEFPNFFGQVGRWIPPCQVTGQTEASGQVAETAHDQNAKPIENRGLKTF